jgi:hypothetical protein
MIRFTDTKSLTMSKKTQKKVGFALGAILGLGAAVVDKILDPSKEELMKGMLETIEKMKNDGRYENAVLLERSLKERLDLMDKLKKELLVARETKGHREVTRIREALKELTEKEQEVLRKHFYGR